MNQHGFDEAARYYAIIASIDPSYESYYGAAICALANGELDKSIRLFKSVKPQTPEIYYYLGVVYYQLGIYDKSTAYFNLSLEKDRRIWQANYYLGLTALKQNRVEDAMEYLKQTPDSVDIALLVDYIGDYERLINARQKYEDGQYNDAIDVYDDVSYFFGYREIGLALAFANKGEYTTSLTLLDSVIDHSDDKELVARSLFETAKIYFFKKNNLKAREYLKKYLAIEPDLKGQFLLGLTYSAESKYDSAITYFEDLPDSIDGYLFYKARTDYFLGLWGKAEEMLLRHREDFPNSTYGDKAIFIVASINFKRKEYDLAIDFWNELVTVYPKSMYAAAAQKGIGDAYFNVKKYNDALNAYHEVKKYNPSLSIESPTTLRTYETLFYLKRYPSIIYALRRFLEENPRSKLALRTRLRIARILYNKKEYYQSLSAINRIIEDFPDSSLTNEALIEKARIHQTIGNMREVKQVFQQLLTREESKDYYSYAVNELGIIYSEESKLDSALFYYNLLLDNSKYREKAIFEIAKTYDKLGQIKESETMIDKLISEFPSSVFLFDSYILKAKAYRNQGYCKEAIDILKELIKKVGQKPEIYVEIGDLYFEMEDYLNARESYVTACEHFRQKRDDAAAALLLAGEASIAIGDEEGAREYFLQASLIAESLTLKNRATAKMSAISEE